MNLPLSRAKFVLAAHKPTQWMHDSGGEVAFAGRSNSGKSSAINAITGRKGLAVASKTPGRTQQIIFFAVTPDRRLVDLPGYGYSKVPRQVRIHWSSTIEQYFQVRQSLRALFLMMDIRHPLKSLDHQMLDWCQSGALRVHILLTKADKLSKSKTLGTIAEVKQQLIHQPNVTVQAFSALSGLGVPEARQRISELMS